MKRVCILLNEVFTFNARIRQQIELLLEAGYQVTIFSLNSASTSSGHKILHPNCKHHLISQKPISPRRPFEFKVLNFLLQVLAHYKRFDVIQVSDPALYFIASFFTRMSKAKLVYDTSIDWIEESRKRIENLKESDPKPSEKALQLIHDFGFKVIQLESQLLSQVAGVIASDEHIVQALSQRLPVLTKESTLLSIYKTVPRSAFRFANQVAGLSDTLEQPSLLRELYNIPPETRIILYNGLLDKRAHLDFLLDLMESLDQCVLIITGKTWGRTFQKWFMRVCQSPRLKQSVFFRPFPFSHAELIAWSQASDLVIYSRAEEEDAKQLKHYAFQSLLIRALKPDSVPHILFTSTFLKLAYEKEFAFLPDQRNFDNVLQQFEQAVYADQNQLKSSLTELFQSINTQSQNYLRLYQSISGAPQAAVKSQPVFTPLHSKELVGS